MKEKLKAAIKRLNITIESFSSSPELEEYRSELITIRDQLENRLAVIITDEKEYQDKNQGKLF